MRKVTTDLDVRGALTVRGAPVSGGGASSLDDLTDIDTTTKVPQAGDALVFNGTEWVPAVVSGGGKDWTYSATPPSNPADGDIWLEKGGAIFTIGDVTAGVPSRGGAIFAIGDETATGTSPEKLWVWDGDTAQWVHVPRYVYDSTAGNWVQLS